MMFSETAWISALALSAMSALALYTVVPAAFVSSVPARLILSFDAARAAWLVAIALFFGLAGATAFTRGLRRYTSGAVWTRG